jgi:Fe-S-cluster containining protein
MSRNQLCFCGSGKKQKKCHSDIHPQSRGAAFLQLYKEIDDRIESYQKEHGVTSPCAKGCYHCCYDDFDISQAEFDLIIHEMKKWSTDEAKEVFLKALDCAEKQDREKPELMSTFNADGNNRNDLLAKQYFDTDRFATKEKARNSFPCPLLDEKTGSCRVYSVRPYMCRTHGSTHYEVNRLSPFEVCEVIPDSNELETITPPADDFFAKHADIRDTYSEEYNHTFVDRMYPIYYWFLILFTKNLMEVNIKYLDYDNLHVSMDTANRKKVANFIAKSGL